MSEINFKKLREELIEELVREGVINSEKVKRAMLKVPRELFVRSKYRNFAYADTPLPIGCGQTISAPHMVALMTEALDPEVGDKVLEIGTGSGYQAAVLAEIVAPENSTIKGHVWTIEIVKELVDFAKENLKKAGYADRVTVIHGDGSLGYVPAAPYDKIIVTAAAPTIPTPLLEQLKNGGKLVIPVGDLYIQKLLIVEKKENGKIKINESVPCVFVPLKGAFGWDESNLNKRGFKILLL